MNEPLPPTNLSAEGDINLSPLRQAWEAQHVHGATRALLDADAEHFLHQSLSTPCFNALASCEGIWLEDIEGRRIMDFHGNNVHQVGYRHPHVMDAVKRQLDTLPFSPRRFTNAAAVQLAAKLTELAPEPLGKVLFAPGGTLAIGMALKLARIATGRHKTLSLWDSFHGASLDAISIGGEAVFRKGIGPLLPGTEHAPPCDPSACSFGCAGRCNLRCAEYLDYVLGKEEDVGAVIIETVRCTDVQIPPPDYYRIVRDACDRHGALLILDEVPICLGRTGKMFAFEHYGIVPDMAVLGKGLGGAVFPMAALIARRDLDVAADGALGHYTHEKSSVGCAAALATIEVIEREDLLARAADLGAEALERMRDIQRRHPLVSGVRGIGLLLAIELARDGVPARREAEQVMYRCLADGLSFKIGQGNVLALSPPLVIAREDLSRAFDIIDAAIGAVEQAPRSAMQVLLNLLAGVALLVWGTHIVRAGILRIYGGDLRRILRHSVRSPWSALLAGLGVTGLIQSSTATALIVAAFAGQGLIATAPALAVMLGADVGTSLMVMVFSLDLSWLCPLLIFVGVVLFLTREATTVGRFGRILIGLGLIILALQWIVLAAKPVTQAVGVKVIFASLTGDILLDMLVAMLLAILSYSSLAVVLLTATFAASHLIGLHVAFGLVLGANLGSGLLAMLNTLHSTPEARRVTLGNFLFKLIGCIVVVPLVGIIEPLMPAVGDEARQVVVFHLLFNIAIAAAFLFLTEPIARIAERLLPSRPDGLNPSKPRHLDPSALDTPALAMSCAAREALRIGDVIGDMLTGMLTVVKTNDRALAERLRKLDDVVDDLYTAVKLYLAQISREALEEQEGRRWADIVSFTINMEQIGDIIERIIIDVEDKKIDKGRNFSEAGMAEICDLHGRLIANLRLGLSVFLNGDLRSAQELLAQKVLFRELERAYANTHLERLAGNSQDSIETSSLHLDLIADLRRINSHICSIAYPILEQAGVLARTRLKEAPVEVEAAAARQRRTDADIPSGDETDGWQKRKPHTA